MAKRLLIDEIRIVLSIPPLLPRKEASKVRRALDSRRFRDRLRRAVRGVFNGFETLRPVQTRITQ